MKAHLFTKAKVAKRHSLRAYHYVGDAKSYDGMVKVSRLFNLLLMTYTLISSYNSIT
jgi:hypothetical protein